LFPKTFLNSSKQRRVASNDRGATPLAQSLLDQEPSSPDILYRKGQSTVIMRTIVVFLVALSVAMLPLASGHAAPEAIPSPSNLVASAHDCCDHDGMPVDNAMKDCQAAAGCAAKCFSVCGVVFSSAIIHPPLAGHESLVATKNLRSQAVSAPFRPPRV
jgi:hypothetical protein